MDEKHHHRLEELEKKKHQHTAATHTRGTTGGASSDPCTGLFEISLILHKCLAVV